MAAKDNQARPDADSLTIRANLAIDGLMENPAFAMDDSAAIYNALRSGMQPVDFGFYLRRYLHRAAGYVGSMKDAAAEDYVETVMASFSARGVPVSLHPTKTKPRAAIKNWLSQKTVSREAVILLGFGLEMSLEEVNAMLTKALLEDELNPKVPVEAVARFCLRTSQGYYRFRALITQYESLPGSVEDPRVRGMGTQVFREEIDSLQDERALMKYLNRLRRPDGLSRQSVEARRQFDSLYRQACQFIANLTNEIEQNDNEIQVDRVRDALSRDDRLYDEQKQARIRCAKEKKKEWTAAAITPVQFEEVLFASVPKDRNGNLLPMKTSTLNEQFRGKRLSRQHIQQILDGSGAVTRYDLATMSFFTACHEMDEEEPHARYQRFVTQTNAILERCGMHGLYAPNPYEAFLMMCMLTAYPLGTYADVWELSYEGEEENP